MQISLRPKTQVFFDKNSLVSFIGNANLETIKDALDEAEYFYRQMEETSKKPREFRYNLNAFVSRARSITWILRKQYSGDPRFVSWYAREEKILRHDELMTFFRDARNISLKEQPLGTQTSTYIGHMEVSVPKGKGFAITGEGEPVWIEKNDEEKERVTHANEFDSEVAREYYFDNPRPPNTLWKLQVIDLCGLYLLALKDLVEKAVQAMNEK